MVLQSSQTWGRNFGPGGQTAASGKRLGYQLAAKQLRAVKGLDTSSQSFADSCEARLRKASAPVAGARRPPEPPRPPRSRARLVEASAPPVVVKQEDNKQEKPARAAPVQPTSPASEVDGDEEKSQSESEREGHSPSSAPYKEEVSGHPAGDHGGAGRRSQPPGYDPELVEHVSPARGSPHLGGFPLRPLEQCPLRSP